MLEESQVSREKEIVKEINGFHSEIENGELTANERAIIQHFLALNDEAYALLDLKSQLGMMMNYISLVQFAFIKGDDLKQNSTENLYALYYALFSEGGLNSIQEVLSSVNKSIGQISDRLIID